MIATPHDIRKVRAVAINLSDEAIDPYIEDAEKQDVLPIIGAQTYFDIEQNREDVKYYDILRGGQYDSCECNGGYSRGLIAAIAYLAYSRMLIFGDIQFTAFGAVLKTAQYSQKPGEVDKIRASQEAKKIGFAILNDVKKHIDSKIGGSCCTKGKGVERPKFVTVKKTKL